jgi:transposase
MRKIRDVLRYRHSTGLSLEAIARVLNISKGVVAKYLRLADDAGVGWPLPEDLDDAALEKRLYQQASARAPTFAEPDYAQVHQELKRKGVTLILLWEEYRQTVGEATYQYTAFCTHYRRWAGKLKRSMRQIHRAGEKLFADYAGPTVPIIDAYTGEIRAASIFVAVLGASSYTFACATAGQTQADWLAGLGRALSYIGGVTELIVPWLSTPTVTSHSSTAPRRNSPLITARLFCRHARESHKIKPRRRWAYKWWNAGFLPDCATGNSSRSLNWTPLWRRCWWR